MISPLQLMFIVCIHVCTTVSSLIDINILLQDTTPRDINNRRHREYQSIFYFSRHHPTQTEAREDRFPGNSRLSYSVNIS